MLKANDRVVVNDEGSIFHQKPGVVVGHYPTAGGHVLWIVLLDDASLTGRLFFEHELIIQEKQDGSA